MSEHRAVLSTLRRFEDPERSRDPQIIELLARLSTADYAPAPRADFRAELRTQLVAITPRIVAENAGGAPASRSATQRLAAPVAPRPAPVRVLPDAPQPTSSVATAATVSASAVSAATVTPIAHRARPATPFLGRLRGVSLARPLSIAASVITVLALLLGGAVWQSRDSLPGDTLYGLKRASESFQLSMDSSDTQRAGDYMQFAGTRVQEAQALVSRVTATAAGTGPSAGARISPQTASLVTDALDAANTDTLSASRLLGAAAVRSASGAPLTPLMNWAPTQLARLSALARVIPQNTELGRLTASSHSLLAEAVSRAGVLKARAGCGCLDKTGTDSLGPLPCTRCSAQPTPTPPKSGSTATPITPAGGTGGEAVDSGAGTVTGPTTPPVRGASSAPGSTSHPLPPITLPTTLPTLPTNAPTLPPVKLPSTLPTSGLGLCTVNLLGIRLCPTGAP